MENKKIGFIGCGAMGSAIMEGIIRGKLVGADDVWAYDIALEKLNELSNNLGINVATDYSDIFNNSDIVFLAIKPGDFKKILQDITPYIKAGHLLVSVAAGISISFIEEAIGGKCSVIRAMPNMPCLIGKGVIALTPSEKTHPADMDIIEAYMRKLGHVYRVEEKLMDTVTALSGSGPGYVYLFLESLTDGAVALGLDRQTASELAIHTLGGAVEMAIVSGKSFNELKNTITSPGGTTIAGLRVMEENAFRGTIMLALAEAARKARELQSNL